MTIHTDRPLALHPLVYLEAGDEVTIGRRDIDSYGMFPPDGAALVRRLAAGATPEQAADWYEREYGEAVDLDDLLAALAELNFIERDGRAPQQRVRWQRLGRAVFSKPAAVLYAAVVAAAVAAVVRDPALLPRPEHLLFTDYLIVIELVLFLGALPQLALHEVCHALAGRRLGLRSSVRVSHRLYYLVLETSLDGLVTVPRRQRFLPILAGMLFELVALAGLVLAAGLTDGTARRLCLAFAFATVLRLAWQFFFYLRTDIYVLICTLLGCVDLHGAARRVLRNRWRRRPEPLTDLHPADLRAARWYSWLIVVGYTVSIGLFVFAVAPVVYAMFAAAVGRLAGGHTTAELLDSALFLAVNVVQLAVTAWLAIRDRRRRV